MLNLKSKSQDLVKFLKHFESHGFVKIIGADRAERFSFGPPGELLYHNLRLEWMYSTVTYREINVFPHNVNCLPSSDTTFMNENLKEGFSISKFLSGDTIPFGLALNGESRKIVSDDPLRPEKFNELRQLVFEKPQISKQYFYRHLQQRKRWWRKFSADPGKFSFSEVFRPSQSSVAEHAQILVTFPWGVHEVENVRYLGPEVFEELPIADQNDFAMLCDRKRCLPHVIESSVNLDFGALTYMFEAYSENKSGRPVMKFHRKLAPYKYGFAASSVSSAVAQELYDMSRMICLDLKKEGWSCLFPSVQELGKKSLDFQLAKHDALGICYTVVLNEASLKSGLCGLYNRETTLQEQTHISKLPEYCSLIMKNY